MQKTRNLFMQKNIRFFVVFVVYATKKLYAIFSLFYQRTTLFFVCKLTAKCDDEMQQIRNAFFF